MKSTTILLILLPLLLSSCGTHQTLPPNWVLPEPTVGEICPHVAGDYSNHGYDAEDKEMLLAAGVLFGRELAKEPAILAETVTRVSLRQPDDKTLAVTAWGDDKLLREVVHSREKGDFECEDGWIIFHAWSNASSSYVGMVGRDTLKFAKAGDFLVERKEGTAFGVLGIIPLWLSAGNWVRYPLASVETSSQSGR